MIYLDKSCIDDAKLNILIKGFQENLLCSQLWDQTRLIRLENLFYYNDDPAFYTAIVEAANLIKHKVSFDDRFSNFQNIEIVKYPTGASKGFHFDNSRDTTTAASITYLNDDYIGGETVIDGTAIRPIKSKTIYFDGKQYKHAVMNVVKGTRYTLSIWYGYDETSTLEKNGIRNIR